MVAAQPKVKLDLYYESLCPACTTFVTREVSELMAAEGVPEITDITFYPYGNARENPDRTFTCQHGPDECKGNMNMACGIYVAVNLTATWFPYVYCMEKGNPVRDTERCANEAKLSFEKIDACLNDKDLSYSIMHGHAVKTDSLVPKKQYVPWVVLNDKPLYTDFNAITRKVCQAYTGTKPRGCNRFLQA